MNLITLFSNLSEKEVEELLGTASYVKARTAFNRDLISKAFEERAIEQSVPLQKKNSDRGRKRTREEAMLKCDEKVQLHDSKEECKFKVSYKLTKKGKKPMKRFDRSPSFGKENNFNFAHFGVSKTKFMKTGKLHESSLPFSRKPKVLKKNIFDLRASKSIFDSIDNATPALFSCGEDNVGVDTTPLSKYAHSPAVARTFEAGPYQYGNGQFGDDMEYPTSKDKVGAFWLSGPNPNIFKKDKFSRIRSSLAIPEVPQAFINTTPRKDLGNLDVGFSPDRENSFISPKKELSFGKNLLGASPITKTPLLKKVYELNQQHCDLFDDDLTKAEHSNLFSIKSNNNQ